MKFINCNVSGKPTDTPLFTDDSSNEVVARWEGDSRVVFDIPDNYTGGGHIYWADNKINFLIPENPGSYEGGNIGIPTLEYLVIQSGLSVIGDHFVRDGKTFWVKGSTDFRLPELALRNGDIESIIRDRVSCGLNWFRMLSMKYNNTGYELNSRDPNHTDAMLRTFDAIGKYGAIGQWDIFADTAQMMPDENEQLDYYGKQLEIILPFASFIVAGVCNEKSHGTQKFNNFNQFYKPTGILSSHGSELTDQLPVQPFWDWSGFSARRVGNLGKVISNYSPLTSFEQWPPVCMIPQEGLKPENYAYNTQVAEQFGKYSRATTGGIFHHNAWVDCRLFNEGERQCAIAFAGE